jgi:hypothetical protein
MLLNCTNAETERDRILLAKDTVSHLGFETYSFEIFSDSSYLYSTFSDFLGDSATSVHRGRLRIKEDSLMFNPDLSFNGASLAVLKNGYVEFVKGEYPYRIKIHNTSLSESNYVDYEKFKDYAVFYDDRISTMEYLEVTNSDLNMIDSLGKAFFVANYPLVKPFGDYLKQVIVSRESNGGLSFVVKCFCKNLHIKSEFRKSLIDMSDGGNCNVRFLIDFNNKTCDYLIIAGEA